MNKTNAGFLAFLGASIVVAIGAFFFAPKLFKPDQEMAALTPPGSEMVDTATPLPDASVSEQSDVVPDAALRAEDWVVPSFDVLRVEPDGSTVIAGKAEPNTTLDIMNGETVIASTSVGPSGDFAVILDTPLAAGDYQLTLRNVGEDGSVRNSEEVATVSIPENASGDLLAMISKPGKASRIIAQPVAPAEEPASQVAAVTPESGATGEAAAIVNQSAVAEATAAPDGEAVETAAGLQGTDEAATKSQDEIAVADAGNDAAAANETPALPDASSLLTTSAPDLATESSDAAGTSDSGATGEQEVAMASPEAVAVPAPIEVPAGANVHVDAVEIEGDKIFIAGSATPGSQVRIAADGVVIGTGTADESGRFIVEAITELSVGDHVINADLMDKAGTGVVLRATVPFNRPEGESLAAVAPANPVASRPEAGTAVPSETTAATAGPEGELILPDIAGLSKLREDAFEAVTRLKDMVSAAEAPDGAAVTAALEDTVAKLKAAAMADLPSGSSDEAMAVARSMRAQAQAALTTISPDQPNRPSAADVPLSATDSASMTGDLAGMSKTLQQAATALSEPAEMSVATTDTSGQSGEPKTIVQAPLASTPGAVIIRRGDTLWQISRRTYGEGVRYTTIYVANRSQISNPDRIRPGQVFSVPDTPLDNAEELHKQLLDAGKNN